LGYANKTHIGRGIFFSCILKSELSGGMQGGTLHKNIALTMLLVFVALSPAASLHATEAQDCSLKQYASIDLEESPNGHLLVPVTIEGTRALMLLNTDTLASTLSEAAVGRLAIQTHSSSMTAKTPTGENYIPKIATAKQFSIGSAQFKNTHFLVPLTSFMSIIAERDYSDTQVIGIIAMDVLASVDVELDIASRKMSLYSQDHCPNNVVYWSNVHDSVPIHLGPRGGFYFPMDLDGKKIEATLSTWQATTTLSTDVTKKLYNFDSHSPDVESETDTTGKTIARYRAMQLDAVGFKVVNAHITLIDPRTGHCHLGTRFGAAAYDNCEASPPLRLGLNVLTKLHIYIAPKEKVLYLTLAGVVDQR
jgi:hypothetical protein